MNDWIQALLAHLAELPWLLQFLLVAAGTLVAEEVAAGSAIGLAQAGGLSWSVCVGGILVGTLVANIAIWAVGRRVGTKALGWSLFRPLQESGTLDRLRGHVVHEGWIAVCLARFVPGTRIPVYLAAGLLGMGAKVFLISLVLSSLAWTGALLGLAHTLREALSGHPTLLVAAAVALAGAVWFLRERYRRPRAPGP